MLEGVSHNERPHAAGQNHQVGEKQPNIVERSTYTVVFKKSKQLKDSLPKEWNAKENVKAEEKSIQ